MAGTEHRARPARPAGSRPVPAPGVALVEHHRCRIATASLLVGALVVGCSAASAAGPKGFEVGLGKYRDGPATTAAVTDETVPPGNDGPGGTERPEVAPGEGPTADPTGQAAASSEATTETSAPAVEAGTDSAIGSEPDVLDEAQRAGLVAFGQAYLSFDYQEDQASRVERLRPFVTEDLLVDLSAPMPPALLEEFVADQRIVNARELDVQALGDSVFQLSFELTRASAGSTAEPELRVLTVVLDPSGLVSDVR